MFIFKCDECTYLYVRKLPGLSRRELMCHKYPAVVVVVIVVVSAVVVVIINF